MANGNIVRIQIDVRVGERTIRLSDTAPIHLSGDQRRWRRQVTEHAEGVVTALLDALGARFKGEISG